MNKIFRIIWSDVRHAYTVVSEIAKSQGKKSSETPGKPVSAFLAAAVLTCGFLVSPAAQAAAPQVGGTNDENGQLRAYDHQYIVLGKQHLRDGNNSAAYNYVLVDNDDHIVSHSQTEIKNGQQVTAADGKTYTVSYQDGAYTLTGNGQYNNKPTYQYGNETLNDGQTYRVRTGYAVSRVNEGYKYTIIGGKNPGTSNVFAASYTGAGTPPTDILSKVDHVTGAAGLTTNLGESLQTVRPAAYVAAATNGTETPGGFSYYIDVGGGQYQQMGGNGATTLPRQFVAASDEAGAKLHWDDAYHSYVYTPTNGTPTLVPLDNVYVITGKAGIFTNADGSLYTGTVYGAFNDYLLTTIGSDGKLYSFWGAENTDASLNMDKYPVEKYKQDIGILVDNDKFLGHNDIHHTRLTTDGTDGAAISLYRNGTDMDGAENNTNRVPGQLTVKQSGGTGGIGNVEGANDRTLTLSSSHTDNGKSVQDSKAFDLGSRVGVTADISGNTRNTTTQNLQSLTINGTTYGLQMKYTGDNTTPITKNLSETLSVTGGAPTGTLTDKNIGVVSDGSGLTIKLNRNVDLTNDGSLTIGNTKVTTTGVTVTATGGSPSITTSGISAGNKEITEVASGSGTGLWTKDNVPAGITDTSNLNHAANIGDIHHIIGTEVDVQSGSNITVSPVTGSQKKFKVDLNDDIKLNGTANPIEINGSGNNASLRLGAEDSKTKVAFDGVKGTGSVAGVSLGQVSVTPKQYTSTTYTPVSEERDMPWTSAVTTVTREGKDGTEQTGNYVTGLDNKDWDWRALSVASGRAATEDQLLKAGQHFFSANPRTTGESTALSSFVNYYNEGASGAASMAIGPNVSTASSASRSIAIGANNTSTGSIATDGTASGGEDALAIGIQTTAQGNRTIAIGSLADAKGDRSVSIGSNNFANGIRSIALGVDVQSGYTANAANVDSNNYASGEMAGGADIAIGNLTRVYGTASTALGFGATVGDVDDKGDMKGSQGTDLALALGGRSSVVVDGGVALGNTSIANRKAGSFNAYLSDYATGADGKVSDEAVKAAQSTSSMGSLRASYDADGKPVPVPEEGRLKSGTAWRSNMGAVSIGTDGTRTSLGGGNTLPAITRQLTGLAAGTEDTDAVNVAQLKALSAAGMNFSGQNTVSATDQTLVKVHTNQGGTLTIQGTDNAKNISTPKTQNIYVTADGTNPDAPQLHIALKDDVNVHTLTAGTAGKNGETGTVTIVGNNGTAQAPSYVAYDIKAGQGASDLTSHADRLTYTNGSDPHTLATLDDGLRFKGDDASETDGTNHVVRKLIDQDITITGGAAPGAVNEDGTYAKLTDNNIGVVSNKDNTGLVIKLAKDVDNLNTLTAGDKSDGKQGVKIGKQTVNKSNSDTSVTNPGTEEGNYATGLDNKDWKVGQTSYVSGRAATEDQLKTVSDQVNTDKTDISTLQTGWEAQVNGTKVKDVVPKAGDTNSRVLNYVAGDNMSITGQAGNSDITFATTPTAGFQTVHVAGTTVSGANASAMTGGIVLGEQTGLTRTFNNSYTTIKHDTDTSGKETGTYTINTYTREEPQAGDVSGNVYYTGTAQKYTATGVADGSPTAITRFSAGTEKETATAANSKYITGLNNRSWNNAYYVSGRAATEDQLAQVAEQIRGQVSGADNYVTGGTAGDTKADGTYDLTLTTKTGSATVTGLHNNYVTNVETSTEDNGATKITLKRNGGLGDVSFDLNFPTTDYRLTESSYDPENGTLTMTVKDAANDADKGQTIEVKDLHMLYGADNSSPADEAAPTKVISKNIGQRLDIKGNDSAAATNGLTTNTYSNGNIRTEVNDNNEIIISMNDNPTLKSLILQGETSDASTPTITLDIGTGADGRLTVTGGSGANKTTNEVAYTSDGLNFTGDNTEAVVTRKLNDTLAVTGDADKADNNHANIHVTGSKDGLNVSLDNDVHVDTLRAGNVSSSKDGSISIVGANSSNGKQEVKVTAGYDSTAVPVSKGRGITRLQYTGVGDPHTVATLDDGYTLDGDSGSGKAVLNGTLKISGGAQAADLTADDWKNIGVTASDSGWTLKLSKDLKGLDTVTAGHAMIGKQTTLSSTLSDASTAADTPGSYVTGLDNTHWYSQDTGTATVYGSVKDTKGNVGIVKGRAATEDQLKTLAESLTKDINTKASGKYGLTSDTGTDAATAELGTNIAVKGKVTTITAAGNPDRQIQNISTSIDKDANALLIGLSDHIELNPLLAGTGSSLILNGANHAYVTGKDSVTGTDTTINTHNSIQIDPEKGIYLVHPGRNGIIKDDGVRITGPLDAYDEKDGIYTRNTKHDSNGAVSITNETGQFTARLSDYGGTGYLGLGNTLPDLSDAQTLQKDDGSRSVAAAFLSVRYGAGSLKESANAPGVLIKPGAVKNGNMTRLQYLDEQTSNGDINQHPSFDTDKVHEIATLDDGLRISSDADMASKNVLLNRTLTITGTNGAMTAPALQNVVNSSAGNIVTKTETTSGGVQLSLHLNKDLKGFNTIQVGGDTTTDGMGALSATPNGTTIVMGNQAVNDGTSAANGTLLTDKNVLSGVGSPLYKAQSGQTTYYTTNRGDPNVQRDDRQVPVRIKEEEETGKQVYAAVDASGNTYYTTDAADQRITSKDGVYVGINPLEGRYITGLENTAWDNGRHIDADRSATEGQLKAAQDYVTNYHPYEAVNIGDHMSYNGGGFALADGNEKQVTQNLGGTVTIKGSNGNISTTADNDGKSITVALSSHLDLGDDGQVKTGSTTVNGTGVTIGNDKAVSLTAGGLDNGNNQIKHVTAGVDDTDAVNVSQLEAVRQVASRHTTVTVENGKEAPVDGTYTEGNLELGMTRKDGQTKYDIRLAKDLTGLTSVTTGQTQINNDGLTITNPADTTEDKSQTIAITQTNISMGGQQVHNVAAGTADTDAVNVSQLKNVENMAGQHSTVSVNGGKDTGNLTLQTSANENGSTNYDVSLSSKITLGTDTAKQVTIDGDNGQITAGKTTIDADSGISTNQISVDGGVTIGKEGINAGSHQITHVASGLSGQTLDAASGDTLQNAVNVGDLKGAVHQAVEEVNTSITNVDNRVTKLDDTVQKGLTFQGDSGDAVNRKLGDTLKLNGGADTKNLSENNIGVVRNEKGDGLDVRLAKDLKGLTSVTTGDTTLTTDGVKISKTDTLKDKDGKEIKDDKGSTIRMTTTSTYGNSGLTITQSALDADGKPAASRTVAVTADKVSMGGNQVKDVASGYSGGLYKDPALNNAASIGDLESRSMQITNNLGGEINRLGNRVNKVGAGAAALAALHPTDFDPDDKWDFAAGYGHYKDANAAALGVYYRPNESTMFSIGGSMGGGENMVNAGVSFKLGQGSPYAGISKVQLAQENAAIRKENAAIREENQSVKQENAEIKQQNSEMKEEIAAMKKQLALINEKLGLSSPAADQPDTEDASTAAGQAAPGTK